MKTPLRTESRRHHHHAIPGLAMWHHHSPNPVMASTRTPSNPNISLEALLAKATPGEPLSGELIRRLRPSGVLGALAQMPLTEILQNMDFGKRSARVDVWPDAAEGVVHVHEGQIVQAVANTSAGTTEGEAAVLELCRRRNGHFRIAYEREEVERNVHRPTTFVLLEALRALDEESNRGAEQGVDAGFDPWGDGASDPGPLESMPEPLRHIAPPNDAPAPALNDPTMVADIMRSAGSSASNPDGARLEPNLPSNPFEEPTRGITSPPTRKDQLLGLLAESELLVASGDLESAKRLLSQAQGLAPRNDQVRKRLMGVNEAIDAAQANAFLEQATRGGPEAVELARRATQLRPVRDVLLRSLAVFARGGAHDEVADVAEQLLELDPDDEGALRTLLNSNIAMRRWPVAMRAAESLLRLRPQDEQLRATLQKVQSLARRPS